MNENAQTAADLRNAAKYIEQHGWHQGSAEGVDGSVCAVGSINAAVGLGARMQNPTWLQGHDAYVRRRRAMFALVDYIENRAISAWNDAPDCTKEEVMATLEKAAAGIEEQA